MADRKDPVGQHCVAGDHRHLPRERLADLPGENRPGNAVHLGFGGEAGTEFNLQDGQQLALPCLKRVSSRLWRKPEHQVRFSLPLVLCLSISLIPVKQVSGGSLRPHLVSKRQPDGMDDGEHR